MIAEAVAAHVEQEPRVYGRGSVVIFADFGGEWTPAVFSRVTKRAPQRTIDIGPEATLPRGFVPLDLCFHGLKRGLCGSCTAISTGRTTKE